MRLYLSGLIFFALLAGCSNRIYQNITSDYDQSVNFNNYRTFAWLNDHQPHSPTPYDNEIIENNIKNYVDDEMSKRNYTPGESQPDLLFELVLSNQPKVSTSITPVYSSPYISAYPSTSYRYYNPGKYRWNTHGYLNNTYTRPMYKIGERVENVSFDQSTITINVFDRISNRLIWTGSAQGDIYDNQYIKDDIHPAVTAILNKFPVKPLKKN